MIFAATLHVTKHFLLSGDDHTAFEILWFNPFLSMF